MGGQAQVWGGEDAAAVRESEGQRRGAVGEPGNPHSDGGPGYAQAFALTDSRCGPQQTLELCLDHRKTAKRTESLD